MFGGSSKQTAVKDDGGARWFGWRWTARGATHDAARQLLLAPSSVLQRPPASPSILRAPSELRPCTCPRNPPQSTECALDILTSAYGPLASKFAESRTQSTALQRSRPATLKGTFCGQAQGRPRHHLILHDMGRLALTLRITLIQLMILIASGVFCSISYGRSRCAHRRLRTIHPYCAAPPVPNEGYH